MIQYEMQIMNGRSSSEPRKKPLRERIRETTEQAIMEAAEEVFADQGLHAAHMGEIAARAGVSVGTLYNHFQDREALLAGLLDARHAELLARVDACLAGTDELPFRQQLESLLRCMLEHAQVHRPFFQILWQGEIGRYQVTFPSACRKPSAIMKEVFGRISRVVERGVEEGQLRPEAAELGPVLFLSMVRGVCIHDALGGGAGDLAGQAHRLIDLFLRGVGA
jgi:AcrR family transcriptional regulator